MTVPLKQGIRDRPIADPAGLLEFTNRELLPLLQQIRNALNFTTLSVVADATLQPEAGLVLVDATDGDVTVTLPQAARYIRALRIFRTDASSNLVTIAGQNGETVNGAASITLTGAYDAAQLSSDGSNYLAERSSQTFSLPPGNATQRYLLWNPLTVDYEVSNTSPRVLDTTYSPIGLWNCHLGAGVGFKDYSGNGNDLTLEAGTARYTLIHPALGCLLFDGLSNWIAPVSVLLRQTGDITIEALCVVSANATQGYVAAHAAAGDTAPANSLYALGVDTGYNLSAFSEHGAGVDDLYVAPSSPGLGVLTLLALTRRSGIWQFYQSGRALGSPSSLMTAPTDGSGGRFRVGSFVTSYFTGLIASVKLIDRALTTDELVAEYNYCLGRTCGFIT